MSETNNLAATKEQLIQVLEGNPENWGARKEVARRLFEEGEYVQAADILWNAPEIPSVDIDVAFSIKIISKGKPNRAIRMMTEIVEMNKEKPNRTMAVAVALFDAGLYMQAFRFYGAALVSDPSLFNLELEQQMLNMDDTVQATAETSPVPEAVAQVSLPVQQVTKPNLVPTPMSPPPKQARQPVPMKPVTAIVELPEKGAAPSEAPSSGGVPLLTPSQGGTQGRLLTPPVSPKQNTD